MSENESETQKPERRAARPKTEELLEHMEFGTRILLGCVFALVFGAVGYGLGSILGTIGSVVLAVPFALVGFIYVCFSVEVNSMIRTMLGFFVDR